MPPEESAKKVQVSLGVDVARFGSDETVIYVLRGPAVVAVDSWSGQDTMKTAGRVIAMALEHGLWMPDGQRIAIDDTGVGGGVVDRLREQGWRVRAINFGSAPERTNSEEKFLNRRTELWWDLREWIRKDAALGDLPADTKDVLRADLCAPKYEQRSDGRIALEPKDKIRARVGRSSDHADSLALAVAAGRQRASMWPGLIQAVRKRHEEDELDAYNDSLRDDPQRRRWGPLADAWPTTRMSKLRGPFGDW